MAVHNNNTSYACERLRLHWRCHLSGPKSQESAFKKETLKLTGAHDSTGASPMVGSPMRACRGKENTSSFSVPSESHNGRAHANAGSWAPHGTGQPDTAPQVRQSRHSASCATRQLTGVAHPQPPAGEPPFLLRRMDA